VQFVLRACPAGSNRQRLQCSDRDEGVPDHRVLKQAAIGGAAPDSTMGIWPNLAVDVALRRPISRSQISILLTV